MVAKSYQNCEILTDPYTMNGKQYVKIQSKTGPKQVRWYTEQEYNRYYPPVKVVRQPKSEKERTGFTNGYITSFKGETYPQLQWFKEAGAHYNKLFGWHFYSTEQVPEIIPSSITPVRVEWEKVSDNGLTLNSDTDIRAYMDTILYDHDENAQFVGEIGDRIEVNVTCDRIVEMPNSYYGPSVLFQFVDVDGNVYVWTTTSNQSIDEGEECVLKGRIKDHKTYRGVNQNVMTRCKIC